jgi:hypothetical protein
METLDCAVRGHDSRSDFSLAPPLVRTERRSVRLRATREPSAVLDLLLLELLAVGGRWAGAISGNGG